MSSGSGDRAHDGRTVSALPVIPSPGAAISPEQVLRIEAEVAKQIALIGDVGALDEMRAKAAALAEYLKGKQLHGPMLGAQRRIEARIGQLLGEAHNGGDRRSDQFAHAKTEITPRDRNSFRRLARGFAVLTSDGEWRQSRRALIAYLQEKYPVPRRQPDVVVQKDGVVKKPTKVRIEEIRKLAADGHRAAQIAAQLAVDEEYVRRLARRAQLRLPDDAIGNRPRIDPARVLCETVSGIDAYVSGLSLLDGLDLPALSTEQIDELMQAVARSINGLRKLRLRMEKTYARTHAPAA